MAFASGMTDFSQTERAVKEIFDDKMHEGIKTNLAGSCGCDKGFQALEMAAHN